MDSPLFLLLSPNIITPIDVSCYSKLKRVNKLNSMVRLLEIIISWY